MFTTTVADHSNPIHNLRRKRCILREIAKPVRLEDAVKVCQTRNGHRITLQEIVQLISVALQNDLEML